MGAADKDTAGQDPGEPGDGTAQKEAGEDEDKPGAAMAEGGKPADADEDGDKDGEGKEGGDKDAASMDAADKEEKEEKEDKEEDKEDAGDSGPKLELTLSWASNYVFRGVSMSNKLPVFQGSVDFSTPLFWGLSANVGLWRSMTRFESADPAADPNADPPAPLLEVKRERGLYWGLSLELPGGFSWSGQINRYTYPGFFDLNFDERGHTLSRSFEALPLSPTLTLGRSKFRSVFYPGSDGRYYELNLELKLDETWGFNFHIGRSRFADQSLGGQDYVDRSFGFNRELNGFQVELLGTNTTTSQFGRLGSPAALVRVSRTF